MNLVQILSLTSEILNRYVCLILLILGNIGNIFAIVILARKYWRKNVCVFYFNICLICNTCYINTSIVGKTLNSFNIKLYDANVVICKIYFYTVYVFGTLLPAVLILASIDRLLISSQNVDTRLYSSKRLAYLSVSCTTIFFFLSFIHLLVKVSLQEIAPSYIICYYDLDQVYIYMIGLLSLIINCLISLTMMILCAFAFKNVRKIIIVRRSQSQQIRTMTKKDFQLLRCLFAHNIIYIIFSLGMSIYPVYQMISFAKIKSPIEQLISDFFLTVVYTLHHIPYCVNFYIYFIISRAFRNEVKRKVSRLFRQQVVPINEEDMNNNNNITIPIS